MNVLGCGSPDLRWKLRGRESGNVCRFQSIGSHDVFTAVDVQRERFRCTMEDAKWAIIGRCEWWPYLVTPNENVTAVMQILADEDRLGVSVGRNYRSKVVKRGAQLSNVRSGIMSGRGRRRLKEFTWKTQRHAID